MHLELFKTILNFVKEYLSLNEDLINELHKKYVCPLIIHLSQRWCCIRRVMMMVMLNSSLEEKSMMPCLKNMVLRKKIL